MKLTLIYIYFIDFIFIEFSYIVIRYLELTDEEKEKLKGSYKVARKLEKLQGKGK